MAGAAFMSIVGNLGGDAELRTTPNGSTNSTFSVAVTRRFTTNGEKREETSWFRCIAWGKLAESVNQYLVKGKQVYVSGRPLNREYEKDGQKRTIFELVVNDIQLLGSPTDRTNSNGTAPASAPPANEGKGNGYDDWDDVPF